MPFCVNDECRGQISHLAKFCPICGTDNRSPRKQKNAVPPCSHFGIQSEYCPKCGGMVGIDPPGSLDGGRRRRRDFAILISLFLALFVPMLYFFAASLLPIPGSEQVKARVDEMITINRYEKHGSDSTLVSHSEKPRGYRDLIIPGAVSLVLLFGALSVRRSRRLS